MSPNLFVSGSYSVVPLIVFFIMYFSMSIMTTGLSVSAGVFVPALLSGAAWGRLIGIGIQYFFPEAVIDFFFLYNPHISEIIIK